MVPKLVFKICMANRSIRFYFFARNYNNKKACNWSLKIFCLFCIGKNLVFGFSGRTHLNYRPKPFRSWNCFFFVFFKIRWVIYLITLPIIKSDYGTKSFRKAFVLQSRSCMLIRLFNSGVMKISSVTSAVGPMSR